MRSTSLESELFCKEVRSQFLRVLQAREHRFLQVFLEEKQSQEITSEDKQKLLGISFHSPN